MTTAMQTTADARAWSATTVDDSRCWYHPLTPKLLADLQARDCFAAERKADYRDPSQPQPACCVERSRSHLHCATSKKAGAL